MDGPVKKNIFRGFPKRNWQVFPAEHDGDEGHGKGQNPVHEHQELYGNTMKVVLT